MARDDNSPFKPTPTRIFLVVLILAVLALSATTIIGSLDGWRRADATTPAPAQ